MKNSVKVRLSDGYVVLDRAGSSYEIELRRMDNHAALVECIYHLCEKRWITREVIAQLIATVCIANNLEIYGHAAK